jgi:hypothetical protein
MRIVTNFWSKDITTEELNRERQMRDDDRFFKLFLDDPAQMVRHDNTIESAHNIIRGICKNAPSVLDIQFETVKQRTHAATSAGITLHSSLLEPAQGKKDNFLAKVGTRIMNRLTGKRRVVAKA